jgi:DNA-binding winged helix-turn-helix (wHTH) protein
MRRTESSGWIAFGPFRANLETGELFKGDVRLSLSGQPFRILAIFLTHGSEIVTREQLRQAVWAGDTFVDFEHGLNTAINRLRRVLSDSAQTPRYIETIPGRGYRFIAEVEYPPKAPHPEPANSEGSVRAYTEFRPVGARLIAIGMVLIIATFVFLSRRRFNAMSQTGIAVSRLTADSGFSGYPSLSRDGNLMAYASDRSGEGRSDLYVQNL